MGNDQSIPPHRMEEPRYPVWRSGTGKLPRDQASPRSLFWRLLSGCTLRLEVNIALCFGDVCRVVMVLHDDDAELDHPHDSPLGCQRHLLPARHRRLQLVEGLPASGQDRKLPRAIFAGSSMADARQICQHSGLQRDSTLHVVIPEQTTWRALPRGHCEAGGRDSSGGGDWLLGRWRQWWQGSAQSTSSWALPAGWDDGLSDVVANHGSLQITGRADYIRSCLLEIVEREGLRLVGQRDETQEEMVDELMKGITDDINNHPLDFFVALRAPAKATTYHGSGDSSLSTTEPRESPEFVVHVQLSPLYPLARERCRMLTPILHPLVTPLLNLTGGADNERSTEASPAENGPVGGRQPSIHEAGRMAFLAPKGSAHLNAKSTKHTLDQLLAWFREEWLVDPVACAQHFTETHPPDATPAVMQWITDGDEMTRRARWLAAVGEGGPRWRPEMHAVCPRAFRAEVRLLLLARQRGDNMVAALPVEVVWHIIDALLRLHIASGSLFFQ